MPRVEFGFDVQCPFAYIASTRIEAAVAAANPHAKLVLTPILLGGLYLLSKAPQGAASASSIMAPNKQHVTSADLLLQARHANVLKTPRTFLSDQPNHHFTSVTPGSLGNQSTTSNQKRIGATPSGCLP